MPQPKAILSDCESPFGFESSVVICCASALDVDVDATSSVELGATRVVLECSDSVDGRVYADVDVSVEVAGSIEVEGEMYSDDELSAPVSPGSILPEQVYNKMPLVYFYKASIRTQGGPQ